MRVERMRTTHAAISDVVLSRSEIVRLLVVVVGLSCFGNLVEESNAGETHASATSDQATKIGIEFVEVLPGRYQRGFQDDDRAENRFKIIHEFSTAPDLKNERPDHWVILSRGFEMAKSEVTVGQFRSFVEATGYVTDAEKESGALGFFPSEKNHVDRFHTDAAITWRDPGFAQTDAHPVVAVSWRDAQAFCAWLTETSPGRFRLPSEAEWEYACRAGTKTWYSWGVEPDEAYSHANVADGSLEAVAENTTRYQRAVALKADEGDGVAFTAPVQSYQPNDWGLYDMHGNVWEWCQDRWMENLYDSYFKNVPWPERKNVTVTDPLFEEKTESHNYGDWRVLRGGAWTCAPVSVRCSIRTFAEAKDAAVYTGFRVVRVADK